MAAMRESRAASGAAASTALRPGIFTVNPVGCWAPSMVSIDASILRRSTLPWCTGPLPNGATCMCFLWGRVAGSAESSAARGDGAAAGCGDGAGTGDGPAGDGPAEEGGATSAAVDPD